MPDLTELLAAPASGLVSGILGSVKDIISQFHTSDAEKLEATRKLTEMEQTFTLKATELDLNLAQAQASVIESEAKSEGVLARNWRPILMLVFTYIIAHNFVIAPIFSLGSLPIPEQMWELLKLGIGGYIGGRTLEKVAPDIIAAVKKK